ncbi:glycine zipper domain-containing protein [Gimibacter soli]|uniref:Glycine zipper domain-containing protein n=1 Tax=Gimibacter soli TaxID=3024400 RepID=A0AAE9XST1_9PROT|nr:glycine zipper domain-containing protein [Gimibacter soli]WCL55717.1 glycine zipper domain-containing protein [Gimibacter soli]
MKKTISRSLAAALLVPAVIGLGACATAPDSKTYSSSAAGQVQHAERGTVESVRQVQISGPKKGYGGLAGAGIGGATGAAIGGHGEGAVAGAIAGALIGGLIGNDVEKKSGNRTGYEYIVKTENGGLVTLVQADDVPLQPGAPVVILYGREARLVLDQSKIVYDDRRSN